MIISNPDPSIAMHSWDAATWLAIGFLVFDSVVLTAQYKTFYTILPGKGALAKLVGLLTHVPKSSASVFVTVFTTTTLLCALSVVVARLTMELAGEISSPEGRVDSLIGIAGYMLGVFGVVVSLNTLGQTKHLEAIQGTKLQGLSTILSDLRETTLSLVKRQKEYKFQDENRFYLLARVPLLGLISEFEKKEWMVIRNAINECLAIDAKVLVICLDDVGRQQLIEYGIKEDSAIRDKTIFTKVVEEDRAFLHELERKSGIVHRVEKLPPVALVVVGNVLFEMVFRNDDYGVGFRECRRVEEDEVVEMYATLIYSYSLSAARPGSK